MTAIPEDIQRLMAEITLQGTKVRDLKKNKAEKSMVDVEVTKLLELKSSLPKEYQEKKGKESKGKEPKIDQRAAKKEARRLAREAKGKVLSIIVTDIENSKFGELQLIQSRITDRKGRIFKDIETINEASKKLIWVRGYVHTVRSQSKLSFLVLRQKSSTIQCVVSDKESSKFVANFINSEAIVDVQVQIVEVHKPTTATISKLELQVEKIFIISKGTSQLPFQVVDASRTENEIKELEKNEEKVVRVGLDTRLDHRSLDLRTPLSQAIVRVTSQVLFSFREFLFNKGFIEICSPKLLAGASEGGAEVFQTKYFETKTATLAQSPQLHKQISAACSGLERVFEVGPVFRAENSNTNRHLCEFTGLDLEMCIKEHYHEVLDVFSDLFHSIFKSLEKNCSKQMDKIREYHPFENIVYEAPESIDSSKIVGIKCRTLRLEFKEAIELLREGGVNEEEQPEFDDLSTPVEKKLGELVKKKYGVDFYFLDKFPYAPRPFYTMPCPEDSRLSNSYDFFIRGQEIMSGAQRVHDADMLEKKIAEKGVPVESLRFYIDAFKQGAMPHGGGGVGLERVVMLFLGLPNIRLVRMFPRDPTRLAP